VNPLIGWLELNPDAEIEKNPKTRTPAINPPIILESIETIRTTNSAKSNWVAPTQLFPINLPTITSKRGARKSMPSAIELITFPVIAFVNFEALARPKKETQVTKQSENRKVDILFVSILILARNSPF